MPPDADTALRLRYYLNIEVLHEVLHEYWEGKVYSGTKFFYTEPLFLNKAHSTK